jgi:hypothetical protein
MKTQVCESTYGYDELFINQEDDTETPPENLYRDVRLACNTFWRKRGIDEYEGLQQPKNRFGKEDK